MIVNIAKRKKQQSQKGFRGYTREIDLILLTKTERKVSSAAKPDGCFQLLDHDSVDPVVS